jgi:hypothetical protein
MYIDCMHGMEFWDFESFCIPRAALHCIRRVVGIPALVLCFK